MFICMLMLVYENHVRLYVDLSNATHFLSQQLIRFIS